MTINERLFVSGLLEEFDDAVRSGNHAPMTDILGQVELSDDAEKIIAAILAHPTRYGRLKS